MLGETVRICRLRWMAFAKTTAATFLYVHSFQYPYSTMARKFYRSLLRKHKAKAVTKIYVDTPVLMIVSTDGVNLFSIF